MSAQAVGVFGVGTEPPPDRTLPSLSVVIFDVSVSTPPRSAWVIWPTFSSSVIRAEQVVRPAAGSAAGFSYGNVPVLPARRPACALVRGRAVARRVHRWCGDRGGGQPGSRHGAQPARERPG